MGNFLSAMAKEGYPEKSIQMYKRPILCLIRFCTEVSGGGRKPWRQKGTGHARQGSTRAPQWKGGGVVFAPVPRDYSFKMNKKEKRAALKSALTSRVQENKLIVIDELRFDEIKTKNFKAVMDNLNVTKAYTRSFT